MIDGLVRPRGVTLRLLLLRHGEPEASARGRCYGELDVGLSVEGRARMERVAVALRRAPIEAVYASPRRRAAETAELLAQAAGVRVVEDPRFAEIRFGELEGMSYDEARERYPELYLCWMERPTEVSFPGGESFREMKARVLSAAAELRAKHADATAVIVSHGGVNRILLADALEMTDRNVFRLAQSYGALNVIDYFGDTPVVSLVNAV